MEFRKFCQIEVARIFFLIEKSPDFSGLSVMVSFHIYALPNFQSITSCDHSAPNQVLLSLYGTLNSRAVFATIFETLG
jgi:hypothetical protein